MSFIHTIADLPNYDELVHPETGTHALITAMCQHEIVVLKEIAEKINNSLGQRPVTCALCCHEWERELFYEWQYLKEQYQDGEDIDVGEVTESRHEWQSAKVSLTNQMNLENAWTDEDEATSMDNKMSAAWRARHQGQRPRSLRFNEQTYTREFQADDALAGTSKREAGEVEGESPTKRQKND